MDDDELYYVIRLESDHDDPWETYIASLPDALAAYGAAKIDWNRFGNYKGGTISMAIALKSERLE